MTSKKDSYFKDQISLITKLWRWTYLIVPISIVIGSVVSFFLWLLNLAIQFHFNHYWLLYLLPLAGLLIHVIYQWIGKSVAKGNILVLEQISDEKGVLPKRMTPIILFTTVITHLFGGSAGREGTAVQIGGSLASWYSTLFNVKDKELRIMLTAGVAAGFGAVFGTPLTGAIFAIEVLTIGKIKHDALLPALFAAFIAAFTVDTWHIPHAHYEILLIFKIIFASAAFGLASFLFITLVDKVKSFCFLIFEQKWLIPVFGGLLIIALTLFLGKPDYLGLGVSAAYPGAVTINSAFETGGASTWSWLWKTIYTAVTLGTGFKGGEVTPLFYIGATLGNTLATLLNAPVSLFAALGFIAVFAGATNTPVACTFMGIELFGSEYILFFAIAI
jgi:H+/Cl- antiporter ClcA